MRANSQPDVLIVSHTHDSEAYLVLAALNRKNVPAAILHQSDFPQRLTMALQLDATATPEVHLTGQDLDICRPPRTVWWRRPSRPTVPELLDPADRAFAKQECNAALLELWALWGKSRWINPPAHARVADQKLLQLVEGARSGFITPRTLLSNHPESIRRFLDQGRSVYKALGQSANHWSTKAGQPKKLYTERVTRWSLPSDSMLEACPGLFQEEVAAAYEVRLFLLGSMVLGARIHQGTAAGESDELDWRRRGKSLELTAWPVPAELASASVDLLERLHLESASIDVVVTAEDKYILLDVNESGQFLFMEEKCGLPLLNAFADFLAGQPQSSPAVRLADVADAATECMRIDKEKHLFSDATALHQHKVQSHS